MLQQVRDQMLLLTHPKKSLKHFGYSSMTEIRIIDCKSPRYSHHGKEFKLTE